MTSQFKQYTRTNIAEMRDLSDFEVQYKDIDSKISISVADLKNGSPKLGDKIARNPQNHDDMWLVTKEYFEENFTEVEK